MSDMDEHGTIDLTAAEAPVRRPRRWLPFIVLAIAIGAVVAAVVVSAAGAEEQRRADRAEAAARDDLDRLEDAAHNAESELEAIVRPATRSAAVAQDAA